MAGGVNGDLEIGTLNAHLPEELARAIVVTPRKANINVKNNIFSALPQYAGDQL